MRAQHTSDIHTPRSYIHHVSPQCMPPLYINDHSGSEMQQDYSAQFHHDCRQSRAQSNASASNKLFPLLSTHDFNLKAAGKERMQ